MNIEDITIKLLTENVDNIFYAITMQTYNGKTLYLKTTGYGNSLEWTFNYDEAIWYETADEAEKVAKKYFKKFKNWEIKSVYTDLI